MSGDGPDKAGRPPRAPVLSDPLRWPRIVELFHAALERPETERDGFLRDACGSDAVLYGEVASMLAADAHASHAGLEDLVPRVAASWPGDAPETLVGQRLGRYDIVAHLGSGGMGDVYRATDHGLGRSVALKVLRPRLLSAPGWRGSLEDEARAASALNHPNIVTVYEIARDGARDFIASELVDGDTLAAALLRHGALSLRELIDVAVQVAAALSAAHAAGIVHRDVKPDNVMLRPDGLVKVVDFGLATIAGPRDLGSRASRGSTMTRTGAVAGTLSYMSPEQALGERLDHRTDLFSLGVVLYEMATGRRPFDGTSEAAHYDVLLHGSPPAPSSLRAKLPAQLDLVIGRALEKDRELRYQSAADLAADLKRLQRPSLSAGRPPLVGRPPSRRRLGNVAAVVALATSGVLAAMLWIGRTPTVTSDARFTLGPPPQMEFALSGTIVPAMTIAISPDGRRLVYLAGPRGARPRLWVRPLASLDAVPLAGTEGASYPFWSPDSQSLGFFADGALKRIEMNGGALRTLATGTDGRGGTWGKDGTILFGSAEGPVFRLTSTGGVAAPVTALDRAQSDVWHRFPQLLPDGRHFVYLARAANGRRALYAASLDSPSRTKVIETDVRAAYAAPGYLLYVSEGVLMARPFDPVRLQVSGEPAQVAAAVATSSAQDASFATSDTGILAYASRTRAPGRLTWLDRAGRSTGVLGEVEDYLGLRRSPDGRTIAVTRVDPSENAPDLWLLDVARGVSSRFTFDPWIDVAPTWAPDGASLVFASSRLGRFQLFRRSAAGGPDETVLFQSEASKYPDDWSPDAQYIVYTTDPRPGTYDLAMLRVTDLQVTPLVATPRFNETQGRISPDGRWLAYTSDETGRAEVHLRGFPSGASHVQLSSEGGSEPVWRGDSRELFYLATDGRLMAVDTRSAGPMIEPGPPRTLFQTSVPRHGVPYVTRYVATADGQRFLFNMPASDPTAPAITVMLDWRNALLSR